MGVVAVARGCRWSVYCGERQYPERGRMGSYFFSSSPEMVVDGLMSTVTIDPNEEEQYNPWPHAQYRFWKVYSMW